MILCFIFINIITLGRARRRWEDGIRMDLTEIGLGWWWIGFYWLRIGTGGRLL
jgi:hypothetical protein